MTDIISALRDDQLLGHGFRDLKTWASWHVVLKSIFGLDLTDEELEVFRRHTGRAAPAAGGHDEAWLVIGRRGGKSRNLAAVATYLSCFVDWSDKLAPGEVGVIMVICQDRGTARHVLGYIKALLHGSPILSRLVIGETADSVDLRGNISVQVHTASFRSIRGRTVLCGIADELAFWRDESSSNPDTEILNALRPSMASVSGAKLVCASSPYARKGALWDAYAEHFGKDESLPLVWQAGTRDMNATVSEAFIDRALAKDEAKARAEYFAEFRTDIEAFVRLETVEACRGSYSQRPYDSQFRYSAFVDPSGGSSDSFTLAISHSEGNQVFVDAVVEKRPPFSPDAVVSEFADILRSYSIAQVTGDRYAGEFSRELFRRHSIGYKVADRSASELYVELLPLLNAARVTLPRSDVLVDQLVGLQRRVSAGGREIISHPERKSAHDDVANAAAGACFLQSAFNRTPMPTFGRWGAGSDPDYAALGWANPNESRKSSSKFDGVIESGELKGGYATSTKVTGLLPGDDY